MPPKTPATDAATAEVVTPEVVTTEVAPVAPATPAPAGPKMVTVECVDPEDPNPTLYLEPEPTVFVNGKAEMKEVLANILVADKGNVYKDKENGKFYPQFRIAK